MKREINPQESCRAEAINDPAELYRKGIMEYLKEQ